MSGEPITQSEVQAEGVSAVDNSQAGQTPQVPDKTFLDQKILERMYRLAVLKTQKICMSAEETVV